MIYLTALGYHRNYRKIQEKHDKYTHCEASQSEPACDGGHCRHVVSLNEQLFSDRAESQSADMSLLHHYEYLFLFTSAWIHLYFGIKIIYCSID